MSLGEEAVKLHSSSMNCAQCVLCAASKYIEIDPDYARRIAAGFGGGIKSGEVCGAVSGAVMALGVAGKQDCTKEFVDDFKTFFGSCVCRELKGKSGIPCDDLIEFSANKLEEVLINGNL